jgi:hypothetical protein
MKCIFSVLCIAGFFQLLFAEAQEPTDPCDPNEKPPIFLPGGIRVEEKDLIVGINEDAMQKAIERDDEFRYQNSWLADYSKSFELREEDDDEED